MRRGGGGGGGEEEEEVLLLGHLASMSPSDECGEEEEPKR
jgi:hypothetical protein